MDFLKNEPDLGRQINKRRKKLNKHIKSTFDTDPESIMADHRYGYITGITRQILKSSVEFRINLSDKIDRVITNRIIGPVVLLLVLYSIYEFTFRGSEAPVTWFEMFFGWLKVFVNAFLPAGLVRSLIVSGDYRRRGGGY